MREKLTPLQQKMLEMLKWFHQFCLSNNIPYYAVGGTMLGAVRHKGFIPWDDDIDVGIPRPDWDRLLEIAKDMHSGITQYVFESYLDGKGDYEYPFAKLYDTTTTLVENKRKHPVRGIYIDIFPLDGIGDSMGEALANFKPVKMKLDLLATKSCSVREGRAFLKNLAVRVVGKIPDSLLNSSRIIAEIDKLCRRHSYRQSLVVGNLVGNWREREIMEKRYFASPTLYRFEDTEIFGVECPDEYLRNLYGDWRKLPPKEKQVSHHDFTYLSLTESYLERNGK